jgi:hypothetical protein
MVCNNAKQVGGETVKKSLVTFEANAADHPTAGVGMIEVREVCKMNHVRILPNGRLRFLAEEFECDAATNPPTVIKLLRRAKFSTREKAEVRLREWMAEAALIQKNYFRKVAQHKARLQSVPRPTQCNIEPIASHDKDAAKAALRFPLARRWPHCMAAINRHEKDEQKLADAYALDAAQITGHAGHKISPELLSELNRAARRGRRSPHKAADCEIELAIALNWIVNGWCFWSWKKIADELSRLICREVTANSVRKRTARLGLKTKVPPGPPPI